MGSFNNYMVAYNFRIIARAIILVLGAIVFFMAFIAGIDDLQGGIQDIILNSPYSLAWLSFLVVLLVSWVWEIVGAITLFILGITSLFFIGFFEASYSFYSILFIFTTLVLSISLFFSWFLSLGEVEYE